MIVPYLSDDVIFHRAEVFLDQYHPTRSLPIPIEVIAETKMNLFILPIPRLESMCEIGGTISKDFKTILIDEKTYMHQEDRARFTIAHEIGHCLLHQSLFMKENKVYEIENFISFQNSLDNTTYKRLEIQAFRFAEEVLCPKEKLSHAVIQIVDKLGGTNAISVTDFEKIIQTIATVFNISKQAAYNKIKREFPSIVESAMSNTPF